MARSVPPAGRDVDKGDGQRLGDSIANAIRTIMMMKQLQKVREAIDSKEKKEDRKPETPEVEIERTREVQAGSPRWLEPAAGERFAIAPGVGVQQLPMSHLERVAFQEGIKPKTLPHTGDGIGASMLSPSPDGGGSIELVRDRPDIMISVRVGDEKVVGSPGDISDNIARQMPSEQQHTLIDAMEDAPVRERVVIFAVDQNDPSNKVAFYRDPQLDQGWTASNGYDEYHLSSEQVQQQLGRMDSQPSQKLRSAIREAVQGDVSIEGSNYIVHVQDRNVVVTDKAGDLVSDRELSEIGERASTIASQAKLLPGAGFSQGVNSAIDDGPQIDREMEL